MPVSTSASFQRKNKVLFVKPTYLNELELTFDERDDDGMDRELNDRCLTTRLSLMTSWKPVEKIWFGRCLTFCRRYVDRLQHFHIRIQGCFWTGKKRVSSESCWWRFQIQSWILKRWLSCRHQQRAEFEPVNWFRRLDGIHADVFLPDERIYLVDGWAKSGTQTKALPNSSRQNECILRASSCFDALPACFTWSLYERTPVPLGYTWRRRQATPFCYNRENILCSPMTFCEAHSLCFMRPSWFLCVEDLCKKAVLSSTQLFSSYYSPVDDYTTRT